MTRVSVNPELLRWARERAGWTQEDWVGKFKKLPQWESGEEVGSPHLHRYREGFGDKWAFPVPPDGFSNLHDPWLTLEDFMRYCNITEPPFIKPGLFT